MEYEYEEEDDYFSDEYYDDEYEAEAYVSTRERNYATPFPASKRRKQSESRREETL